MNKKQELEEFQKQLKAIEEDIEETGQEESKLTIVAVIVDQAILLNEKITELAGRSGKAVESAKQKLIETMQAMNLDSMDMNGKKFSWSLRDFFSVPADQKNQLFEYLRERGKGDIIKTKEDVHYQTLNAYFNNEHEGDLPEWVNHYEKEVLSIKSINNKSR
jgi:hypothetical protein